MNTTDFKTYAGKKVLVVGGLGFIGSNLVLRLVDLKAEVSIVDALTPHLGGKLSNIAPVRNDVTVEFSDMRSLRDMRKLVDRHELIFLTAGQGSHVGSIEDPLQDLDLNCRGRLSLLDACRWEGVTPGFVYVGTRQVYGRPTSLPVDETHATIPLDINGIHYLAVEAYFRLYHELHGIPSIGLRLTNTYGPRMSIDSVAMGVVGAFVGRALRGESLQLFGDGLQIRDFSFVDDVVDALLRCGRVVDAGSRVVNIGGERSTLQVFAELLASLLDVPIEYVPFPKKSLSIDIGDYVGDYCALQSLTGWRPTVGMIEGLERTIAYFRSHQVACNA